MALYYDYFLKSTCKKFISFIGDVFPTIYDSDSYSTADGEKLLLESL